MQWISSLTEKIYDIDFDTYDNDRLDRGLELFGKHFCSFGTN